MATNIKKITNANVYLDGRSLLGQAEEIEIPNIQHVLSEHKALGMLGTTEHFSGLDKMEARIKWTALYAETFGKAADPTKAWELQCRSSLETHTSAGKTAEVPAVVFLTGTFKNFPTGSFKAKENAEYESNLTITYVKMEVDGAPIIEVDAIANIYKVNGVDILANYRNNLGI